MNKNKITNLLNINQSIKKSNIISPIETLPENQNHQNLRKIKSVDQIKPMDPFYKIRNQTLHQDEVFYNKTNKIYDYGRNSNNNIENILKFDEKKVKNNIDYFQKDPKSMPFTEYKNIYLKNKGFDNIPRTSKYDRKVDSQISFNRTKSSKFFRSSDRFYSKRKYESRIDLNNSNSEDDTFSNKKLNSQINLINQTSNNTLNPSFCIKSAELLSNRESINQDERNQLIKEFAKSKNLDQNQTNGPSSTQTMITNLYTNTPEPQVKSLSRTKSKLSNVYTNNHKSSIEEHDDRLNNQDQQILDSPRREEDKFEKELKKYEDVKISMLYNQNYEDSITNYIMTIQNYSQLQQEYENQKMLRNIRIQLGNNQLIYSHSVNKVTSKNNNSKLSNIDLNQLNILKINRVNNHFVQNNLQKLKS